MPQPPATPTRKPARGYALRVNAYDRASSVLVALLTIVGLGVGGLVIVYFTSSVVTVTAAIPVTAIQPASGASTGAAEDPLPGVENAPDVTAPDLSSQLNLMAGLIAQKTSLFDDAELDDPANQPSRGTGLGDARSAGVGAGPPTREPQRELRFEPGSIEEYAAWLDAKGFELAVLGDDDRVYYASGLSQSSPAVRDADPADEGRLYFNASGGPLAPLNRRLLAKAGLAGRGQIVLLFCGAPTQQELLTLEASAAGARPLEAVRLTVFRVERGGGGYTLSVEEQTYNP